MGADFLGETHRDQLALPHTGGYSARQNGRLWGLRQTYLDLLYLATHPQSLVTGLTELPKLPKALANLPQATYQYQDRHNPFEKSETENYALYGGHWVTGYVEGVPGGEVLLSKGVGKVSKVGKVQRVTDAVRGAKIASKGWAFRQSVGMAAVVSKKGPDATAARRVLDSVAVPKRVRVARQLGSERVQTIASRVDDTVPNAATRVGRATVRTGDLGRRLLVYFKDFGKTRALGTYLTMKDRAAMQRTLARAYSEHPDVTKQDIGAALRRYDSLETRAQKRAMRDVWAAAGADGVAATGAIDPATLERLLVTGDRTDSVTASDVGAAAKTYSKLDSSGKTTYENLLDRKPEGATTLAADADSDSLSTPLDTDCLQTRDVGINGRPVHKEEHPAPETLSNINEVGSVDHLFITGEHGRISLRVTDDGLENETTADEPTDPDHWDPE